MNLFLVFVVILLLMLIMCSLKKKHNIDENTIWTYWEQGRKNIYPFHKLCIKTWKQNNPKYRVIIVDKNNVYNYLDKKDLPPNWEKIEQIQHKSDFVRIALLEKYGGIWIDISTICLKPIDSVFTQTKSLEGFSRSRHSRTKDLSIFENGFISAKKGSRVIKRWKDEFLKAFGNSKSVEDMDKSYFEGVDFQNIELEWYLTMYRVLMKLNQLDPEIKDIYFNDSTILEADKTMFLHYIYFDGWEIDIKQKYLEANDDYVEKVKESGTPILKFINSGGTLKNTSEEEVLRNKDSVLYKLIYIL